MERYVLNEILPAWTLFQLIWWYAQGICWCKPSMYSFCEWFATYTAPREAQPPPCQGEWKHCPQNSFQPHEDDLASHSPPLQSHPSCTFVCMMKSCPLSGDHHLPVWHTASPLTFDKTQQLSQLGHTRALAMVTLSQRLLSSSSGKGRRAGSTASWDIDAVGLDLGVAGCNRHQGLHCSMKSDRTYRKSMGLTGWKS